MSEALRVVHVIEAMHQGGAEAMVVEHVRHAAPDVESWVVALNRGGPALDQAARAGARVEMLGKGGRRGAGVARLAARMRAIRPHVVNGHNPTGSLYGTLAARLAGVPVVFRTEHSIHYAGRHSRVYPALEILTTLLSRRVVCVCEAVLHSHVRRLPWAAERFVSVANGIPPAPHSRPRESVRAALGVDPATPLALTVGSLTAQKAQQALIEAWARVAERVPGARLLIAGEGPLRPDLERAIAALGLAGSVTLLGARLDAPELMEACDVFVLSSVREGLSITLLEAMRAGRPCVATRIGGNGEAVEDGVTGRLVAARDPEALAEALAVLLADRTRAAAMGAAGRRRWAERFTAERMVRDTESLYREALGRRVAAAAEREAAAR